MSRVKPAALGLVVAYLAAGCTGRIDDDAAAKGAGSGSSGTSSGATGGAAAGAVGTGGNGAATGGGGAGAGAGAGAVGGTGAPGTFVPASSRLRRLTSFEYKNSIIDLLGAGTQVTTGLEADPTQNHLTSIAASSLSFSGPLTDEFETSALALSDALVKDAARRVAVVGCTPSGPADATCLRTFVTSFGRRAFRRPLSAEEVDLYAGVGMTAMTALSDFWGGVRFALAGLLQSPSFLYRTEIGSADPATPDRRALDGYELASRLSYLLWSTTPDDALLDSAAQGVLSTPEGLAQAAEGLLASPRAEGSIVRVLSEMLRLSELDSLPQLPQVFPQAASATLGASMRTETENVLRDLVFTRNADYRELFTTTQTFLNGELASLYGVAGITGTTFVPVALPADGPRAGYLGQGSFLALNAKASNSSPTFRGKFIVESLLCTGLEPPPNDVITELPETDASKTMREQLLNHQVEARCAGCHSIMDPPGLALEHFDGIGAYRATDRGMALDVSGDIDGSAFNGARELGRVLADQVKTVDNNPRVTDCLVRNLFRAATGHLEGAGDLPVITGLSTAFTTDGFRVRALLTKLVTSEGFRVVGQPE